MNKKAVLLAAAAILLVALIAVLVNGVSNLESLRQSGEAASSLQEDSQRSSSGDAAPSASTHFPAEQEETPAPSENITEENSEESTSCSEGSSGQSETESDTAETEPTEAESTEPTEAQPSQSTEAQTTEPTEEQTTEPTEEQTTEQAETEPTSPIRPTEPPTMSTQSTEVTTEPTVPPQPTSPTQPSTAHTHTTAERVKKAATCKETGTKEIYCTECREVLSTVTIQKLAHTTAERTKQAATCTAAGVKEIYCTKCGDVISTASIPKLSHTTERQVVREATTTAEGLYQMVCTVCHTVVSEGSIPMIETEPAPTFYVHVEPPVDQHSVQCGYGSLAGAEYSLYRVNIGAGQTPSKTSPMTLIETFVSGADGTANSRSVETERDVWYCYRNSKASPGFVMFGTGGLSGKYFFFRNKSGVVNYTSDLQSYYKFEEDPTPGLLAYFKEYAESKGFRTDIKGYSYDNPITVPAGMPRGYEAIKSRIDTYAQNYLPTGQITRLYAEVTGHRLAGEDGHADEEYIITIFYSNGD